MYRFESDIEIHFISIVYIKVLRWHWIVSYNRIPKNKDTLLRNYFQSVGPMVIYQMANAVEYAIICAHLKRNNNPILFPLHSKKKTRTKSNVIALTVPSGSKSSRCFGICPCNPVRTYCPGLPCDSRTKKSPSCLRSASAACRLIDAWNHGSVSNCDRWTSADNENGSIQMNKCYIFNYHKCR